MNPESYSQQFSPQVDWCFVHQHAFSSYRGLSQVGMPVSWITAVARSSVCPHLKTPAHVPAPLATTCAVTVSPVKVGCCLGPCPYVLWVSSFFSLLSGILVVFRLAACFVMWKVPKESCMMSVWPPSNISRLLLSITGLSSFLMYSFHEGIRGIALDPSDHGETLMPISGTLFAVGVDFHAGTNTALPMTQSCYLLLCSQVYRSALWIISMCTTKIRNVFLSVNYFFYVVCCQMYSLILATQSLTRSEGT